MCLVEIGRPMLDRNTGQVVMENGQPKIQFMPKLETACTNRVSEGMVVMTTSDKAMDGQKGTVEFLLTSHPLDCPVCDKGGECPLQNLTMQFGPGRSRFIYDEKLRLEKQVPLGELIWLDRERCIQCARCIRFQDEIAGEAVLGFDERGRNTQIVSLSDPGFDSVFSGNTTDICPVGALTTADFRFGARPWELKAQASICTQCPVGCNTTLNTRREAKAGGDIVVKRVMPRQNEEVNEIWLCDKGRFAYHYVESEERLDKPLISKDGKLGKTSWKSALDLASEKLAEHKKNFVVLASGRLSNEDLFN
jgi:NADH dehydrogenase/NADH:ubiquinone oxidoreductase 75 kD subunit (chain G)